MPKVQDITGILKLKIHSPEFNFCFSLQPVLEVELLNLLLDPKITQFLDHSPRRVFPVPGAAATCPEN